MTKRNLFAAFAALCAFSALIVFSCDHALSQQTASVTFSIPADVLKGMLQKARPASEQEIAKMARAASRQAAGADGAYATLTVSLSDYAEPQTRFFTRDEFNAIESGASAIAPFDFTGLPVGARVTVTAALLLTDGMYYEDSAEVALAVGPNSVSLTMRAKTRRLAGVTASPGSGSKLTRGDAVTFSVDEPDAAIFLSGLPAGGASVAGGGSPIAVSSGGTAAGAAGQSVTVTFVAAGGYSITAYAAKDGFGNSKEISFDYTVENPPLGGNFTRAPENDITAGNKVTFSYSDADATISLALAKTGGGTVTASDVAVTGGSLSGSTVTATGSPANSVTLTFNTVGGYTVTPTATKANHKPQTGRPFTVTVADPITFVSIAGATVSTPPNGEDANGPFAQTKLPVTVAAFRIAETELTYAQWKEVYDWATTRATDRYTFANAGLVSGNNEPVVGISWRDAMVWCNAASEREGLSPAYLKDGTPVRNSTNGDVDNVSDGKDTDGYRLPTEAEWEFAARGGKPDATEWGYTYAGSNVIDDVAWYANNNPNWRVHDVKGKDPNSAGLYDMTGNVWEWCGDTSASSSDRVHRGGGWNIGADDCTVAYRGGSWLGNIDGAWGFRVVRSGNN